MKRIVFLLLVTVLLFALTGCGPGPADPEPPETPDPNDEPIEEEVPFEYEVVEGVGALPEDIQNIIPVLKEQRGYYVFRSPEYDTGEEVFIVVFAGEKPTGGYDLRVESLQVENDTLQIIVEETEPKADEHVIQVLTYPMATVAISKSFDHYQVIDTKNDAIEPISPDAIPEIQEGAGVYQGLQDSNSLEILVEGQPKALRFLEHHSAFDELLNFGDNVVFKYYQNEHGQKILVDIDTAERAGMIRGAEGVFEGQMDSHTVEITINGEPMAFTFAEQVLIGQFDTGNRVILDYYEAANGRLVITRMEKK